MSYKGRLLILLGRPENRIAGVPRRGVATVALGAFWSFDGKTFCICEV
jgi:hypothetical protein